MRASGIIVGLTLVSAVARAQSEPPHVVDLTIAAETDAADSLEGAIAELLAGLGVTARPRRVEVIDPRQVVIPPDAPPPALARVWIAVDPPNAILYLADAPWERVLVRRVPIGDLDVASREQLAQIVHTAIEALLAGASIGLTRAEAQAELVPEEPETSPEPPAPEPIAQQPPLPPPERAKLVVEGWLGVGLPLWSDGPRAGAGIFGRGGVVWQVGRVRPLVSIEARGRPSTTTQTSAVALSIWSVAARIEGGAELAIDPETAVRAVAGIGLEVTSVSSRANEGTGVTPAPAREDLTAMLTSSISITRALAGWLWASAGVSLDVDLVDTRYVVVEGDDETVVLDPWSVRPWPWLAVGGRL